MKLVIAHYLSLLYFNTIHVQCNPGNCSSEQNKTRTNSKNFRSKNTPHPGTFRSIYVLMINDLLLNNGFSLQDMKNGRMSAKRMVENFFFCFLFYLAD